MKKDIAVDDKMGYAIRTENFRYVEWYKWNEGKKGKLLARELYDEHADPNENHNISSEAKHQLLIKKLSEMLFAND